MLKEKLKNKNHTSHFALHTSNRGITLIALIITIIVMLILTGVTLSITLGDNGLVNKAKTASEEMQKEMDRELLLSAVVGAIGNDGKVNLSAINLPEGFTGSNGTYTSGNGYSFKVDTNGTVTYMGENANTFSADLEALRTYFLEKKGSELLQNTEVMEGIDYLSDIKFKNNDILADAENIEITHYSEEYDENLLLLYFPYNNNTYILSVKLINDDSYSDAEWVFKNIEILEETNVDLNGTYYMFTNNEGYLSIGDNKFSILDEWGDSYEVNILKTMKNNKYIHYFMDIEDDIQYTFYLNYKDIYNNNEKVNRIIYMPMMSSVYYENLNELEFDLDGNYVFNTSESNKARLRFEKDSKIVYYELQFSDYEWETREQIGYFEYDNQYTMVGSYEPLGIDKGYTEIEVSEDMNEITMDGNVYVLEEDGV